MSAITRRNLRTVHLSVAAREEFSCNYSLTGTSDRLAYVGYLPKEYHEAYTKARSAPDFYMVRSYSTPIAWYANGEWTKPPVKYSSTTSRHQSSLRLYDI
jgi:hypothetical protein